MHKLPRSLLISLNLIVLMTIFYFMIGRNLLTNEPPDWPSFAFTVFSGYLFFLLIPVELIFIYFSATQDPYMPLLVPMTLALAMAAQSLDYAIGRTVNNRRLKSLIGPHRFKKAKKFLKKYGVIIFFTFNVFPLSSPILILVAGMFEYPFRPIFFYSLAGLTIKYSFIALFLT